MNILIEDILRTSICIIYKNKFQSWLLQLSSFILDRQTNPQTGQSLVSNGESLLSCAHLWSRNYTSGSGFYTNFRGHCTLRNKNLSALVYSIGICDNGKNTVMILVLLLTHFS